MNLLFIGSIYSETFKDILKGHNLPVSSAGQTFQNALLSGLDSFCNVRIISEFFVPVYPKFNQGFIKSDRFNHCERNDISDVSISFYNIAGIKKFSQFISYIREIKKQAQWADVIVVYEATSRQLLAPLFAAKDKTKIVIVPDLPEFMSDNRNPLYLAAKKFDKMLIDYALKKYDGFVLLSKYMAKRIKVGNRHSIVLEGIFNLKDQICEVQKEPMDIVLYSGKIEKWFGLEDLLRSFCKVKGDNYQLWLCGPGDIDMVNQYAQLDRRIKYMGCLSHEDVLKYQKKASLLVNPRHSTDDYTLFSFPSKTMEYMASGTPTLMCKLKSLPDEYLEHLYLFDDESVDGMARRIQECLNIPKVNRDDFGKRAADFIIKNKNSTSQGQRIVKFINTILNEKKN